MDKDIKVSSERVKEVRTPEEEAAHLAKLQEWADIKKDEGSGTMPVTGGGGYISFGTTGALDPDKPLVGDREVWEAKHGRVIDHEYTQADKDRDWEAHRDSLSGSAVQAASRTFWGRSLASSTSSAGTIVS